MTRFVIQGARVVTPDGTIETDVVVEGSRIADVDPGRVTGAETIDARGLVLLPGVIDDQVHFRQPGLEHKEDLRTASRACAKGGVTSYFDMPNTVPPTTTQTALDAKLALAAENSLVNYGFFVGATTGNLADLKTARRTPGIKIFIGSSTGELLVDDQATLERIFAETSLPVAAHCEDESTVRANAARLAARRDIAVHSEIRDPAAALIATRRAVDLATRHRHRLHVLHVSTADEIPVVAAARPWVTAEVCPHHLWLNVGDYERLGGLAKVNPSLKTVDDNRALWQALRAGDIQLVATDHAPHTLEEKAQPYPQCPAGMPSVENVLALLLDQVNRGNATLDEVARWTSYAPALVWDTVGKGRIEPGYDADLVLVDLELSETIDNATQQTKCGWSPWHGTTLRGWPVRTWVMGREVFRRSPNSQPQYVDGPAGTEVRFDHSRGGYWA